MNLPRYSLDNRKVIFFFLAILLVGGIVAFTQLGKKEDSPFVIKSAAIVTRYPGATPEEVEQLITEPIEREIQSMRRVYKITSESWYGMSKIMIELQPSTPAGEMPQMWDELRRKIMNVQPALPDGASNISVSDDFGDVFGIYYGLSADEGFTYEEMRDWAQRIKTELVTVPGVQKVTLFGEQNGVVNVYLSMSALGNLFITPDEVIRILSGQNTLVGSGEKMAGQMQIKIIETGTYKNLDDIRNQILTSTQGLQVRLGDIARIEAGYAEPPGTLMRVNGRRAIGIGVSTDPEKDVVKTGALIERKLAELNPQIPIGITLQTLYPENQIAREANNTFIVNLIESISIVIVLIMLIMGLRAGILIGSSLIFAIGGTLLIMQFLGVGLNRTSLAGFIIAMGMLVDNAIVVMENIFRNMDENNLPPAEAAVRGTSEVAGAITASTLTTIVVFLPIVYLQGAAGELFKEQAWTVSFSLLSSLFVSILFIPMLASKFMRKKDNISSHAITIKGFGNFVGKVLKRKYLVIGVATILMIVSYLMLPLIGMEFMPKTESKEFSILVTMEPGTRLKSTDNAVGTIEDAIRTLGQDDIEWQYTLVGPSNLESQSGGKLESENQSQIKVKIKKDSKLDADYFITNINENYPLPEGVEISYEKGESALQSILGTEGAPLVIEVKGEELELLDELCTEIKEKITGISGIYDIKSSLEKGAPEVNIKIDRLKSGIYGIDVATVSNQVSEKLAGKDAGTFETQGETIDINIKVPEVTLSEIYDIEIVQGEKKYRLGEIADIEITSAPKEINRVNQSRTGIVTAMLEKQYSLSHVTPAIKAKLSEVEFPAKYSAKITGEEEMRQESFSGLGFALFLSILLVYMVMAAQFESLRHPFTILLTIPLAGVGCILAFLLTGQTLNMMAFIGIIMLAGIAVNSSIILVDAINRLKEEGHPLEEAIQMAAQHRVRPIIMTSATTILALLPMCFGFGEGASLRSPMALAVIGGLLTSTIMTLIVIPCVYYVIDRKKS